ncbi:MAG: hypothetical protein A2827_03780 [Candidatus Spechtbacteria bacterium RIFCSPHIGHO2_01_FULL_43_30]|uniref:CAAX prenyl protease 2/Lysostaphin resistance protein A-like domain-containing protein n=1 Tax=Candidatus Spechtbacteria bacterium RIFCSPHIGHO2_01_FULL_43_30 TaxID=1802158 RepID=A0A1G2H8Q6_9BACT|nr:MAG: hypothetical protein A2827_03780 [Candidatus Spechtbacteria bacterium RIFCSPHIGHO2_01_FULL_43_30]
MKWVIKRFGDNFKSTEWHKKNQWRVIWTVGTPLTNVWAPAVEELIFRAPLIIAFGAMSSVAWYGVFVSSGLFALSHWFGNKIWMPEILSARENGDHKSDDVVAEVDRLHQKAGRRILVQKVLHVVLTFPLGILAGYYGIKYQSIWVSFGIHSAWNLIMPFVLPLFVLLGMLAFLGISSLWDRMRWKWRRS